MEARRGRDAVGGSMRSTTARPAMLLGRGRTDFGMNKPSALDIQQHLLSLIESIGGAPTEVDMTRFMNIFYEGTAPATRTSWDVMHFTNSVSTSWRPVHRR